MNSETGTVIGGDGFDDVTHEEFNELIDAHSQALTDKIWQS